MNTLGERLKYAIKLRGRKQVDVAKEVGIAGASLSQFCSNVAKPSDRTIRGLCCALRINEQWLRSGEEPMEPETPDTFTEKLREQYGLKPYAARVINALAHAARDIDDDSLEKLVNAVIGEMQKIAPSKDENLGKEQAENVMNAVVSENTDQSTVG